MSEQDRLAALLRDAVDATADDREFITRGDDAYDAIAARLIAVGVRVGDDGLREATFGSLKALRVLSAEATKEADRLALVINRNRAALAPREADHD